MRTTSLGKFWSVTVAAVKGSGNLGYLWRVGFRV